MTDITRRTALKYTALLCTLPIAGSLGGCMFGSDEPDALSDAGAVSDVASLYSGAVATNAALATEVGRQVLEEGGNAVDAAVAIGFALGVVQPYGSGLGGGGGMLVYDIPDTTSDFIDYRVAAPASFARKTGTGCVPGLARGLEYAHQLYGSKPWTDVVEPACRLAREGFEVDSSLASYLAQYQGYLQSVEGYWADGEVLGRGDTLVQPALAEAMEAIRDGGADAFYGGDVGSSLALALSCESSDLSDYQAKRRECLVHECLGATFVSAPAPFAGAAVVSLLKGMEQLGAPSASAAPQDYVDALSAASSLSNKMRAAYVADPDYVDVTSLDAVLSDEGIASSLAHGVEVSAGSEEPESDTTSAYAVMDASGLLVVATNTLGEFFGSGQACRGFFLNNGMDSFSAEGVNSYEAGKRPRTYTAPTVVDAGGYVLGAGSPGGTRIPRILSQVLYSIVHERMPVQDAVDRNRVLCLDDETFAVEKERDRDDLLDVSQVDGYAMVRGTTKTYFGAVEVVGCDSAQGVFAVNDDRRAGSAEVLAK